MNTKTLLIAILILFCLASCKKSDNSGLSSNQELLLNPPAVSGNIVTLTWSALNGNTNGYVIVRVIDTTVSNNDYGLAPNYKTFGVPKGVTQFVDTLPSSPSVQYYLLSSYYSSNLLVQVTSNKVTYDRSDIAFITPVPSGALYNKDTHQLYAYSTSGNFNLYDVPSKKIIKQMSTSVSIGYCDLGTYNGTTELYVPGADNWLHIYNAATLDQIDKIKIDSGTISVVYSNGILFCSSNDSIDNTTGEMSGLISAYNRSTKNMISQTTSPDAVRLKKIPGTNTELFGITTVNQGSVYHYTFSTTGIFNTQQNNPNWNVNSGAFEVFPDGNYLITSSRGLIFNKSLTLLTSLTGNIPTFGSFDFDNVNRLIYGGSTNTIQAYSMDNYQLTKTIKSDGYPIQVFYDNGSVISLSAILPRDESYGGFPKYAFIEQH